MHDFPLNNSYLEPDEALAATILANLSSKSTSTVTPTRVSEDSDWGVIPHRSKIASEAFDAVAKL